MDQQHTTRDVITASISSEDSMKPRIVDESIADQPKGTVLSGWSVMANSMIGTGVLGLASAFAQSGWLLGLFFLACAAFLAIFSLHLLNILSLRVNKQVVSFYVVAEAYAPWSKVVVDATIIIKCFGVAVSYLQVAGDMLSLLIIYWSGTDVSEFTVRALVIAATGVLMAPICMSKTVKNTFLTNILAVVTIGYCVLLGIIYADVGGGDDSVTVPAEASLTSILAKLPVFIFAFTCHQNMFLTCNDMKDRTQKKLDIVILAAEGTAMLLYLPAIIFPYLTHGSAVQTNFLRNMDLNFVMVQIGYVALTIGVLCSYVLQVVPTIRSVIVLVTKGRHMHNNRSDNVLFYFVSIVCQLAPISTAIAVRSLGVTFSFVGILGSNTISFIMPSFLFIMMYKKCGDKKGPKYWIAVALLFISVVLVPLCVGSLIQQIVTGNI